MEVSGGGGRRRRSLSDESLDNPNLRDFLRVKQEGDESHTPSGTTLGGVLADKEPPAQTRTLLDIIRDDPTSSQHGNRKTWRVFRDKLRLKRAGAAWTSSVHVPTSDVPIPSANRMMLRRQSTRYGGAEPEPEPESGQNPAESELAHAGTGSGPEISRSGLNSLPSSRAMMLRRNSSRMPSLANTNHGRDAEMSQTFNTARSIVQMADQNAGQQHEEEGNHEGEEGGSEEGGEGGGSEEEEGEGEPEVRMSLMALLAETDRAMGIDGSPFIMDDDGEDEDEEEEVVSSGAGDYNNCCVCMVRHKGAAFIPCGHTFCRLCSRELWVQRGSCPLCNNFILEILDIF